MATISHLAPDLLLLHVLLPFAAGGMLAVFGNSRCRRHCEPVLLFGLACTSLLLLVYAIASSLDPGLAPVFVSWNLPGAQRGIDLVDRVLWGADLPTSAFLAVIPWLAMTAARAGHGDSQSGQPQTQLWLLGAMDLFLVGRDFGSILAGAGIVAAILSIRIARFGGRSKRSGAATLMSVQYIGICLMGFALSGFSASAGVIRGAPRGTPAASVTTLPDLADHLHHSFQTRPGAMELWSDSRGLPVLLMVIGSGLLCAAFPLHSWFSEAMTAAAIGDRLWLIAWTKAVLFVSVSFLFYLDPGLIEELSSIGSVVVLAGSVFAASQIYSQNDFPRLQSSALLWSQQLALFACFLFPATIEYALMPTLLVQLAGLILWSMSLSTISERYGSIELSAYQGLADRAEWLPAALLASAMLLTLTPLGMGLFQAWLATTSALNADLGWSICCRWGVLVADLFALAGFLRVYWRLVSGPSRVPEMSPALQARMETAVPVRNLQLSFLKRVLLWGWGIAGILGAIVFPLLLLWAWQQGSGE
jgi:hypothetical protein